MPEVICSDEQILLIDVQAWPEGEAFAVAHCVAHLDLEHHTSGGDLSTDQEEQADWLAQVRLDEEGSRECA